MKKIFRGIGIILWSDIHQSFFIVAGMVGIILGMILALIFRINYFASGVWIVFAVILLIFTLIKPKFTFIVIAFLAGMILAFVRVAGELSGEEYIRQFYGKTVVVSGVINGDAETDEGGTTFKVGELRFGGNGEYAAEGSLYISGYKNEELMRSDRVVLKGRLDEGFGVYVGYMYRPRIENWARAEPGDVILGVRNWFAERIRRIIPETEANLGISYLLGMKVGLSDEFNEQLRMVGLVHIVVASGAHLSILMEIVKKIFGKISRFASLLFSVLFIVIFMAMVGWTASILRAGIMAVLSIIGWYYGRKAEAWRLILIAMAVTLMMEPMFLINLGWLLSFGSYAGIMILGPRIQEFFYKEKKPGFIAGMILTTVSATLMTMPVTLYYFGQISLISVLANLLILPTLPYAMGLTFLAGVLNEVPIICNIVAFLTTKMLDFHIFTVGMFSKMEEFLVTIPCGRGEVFLIYGVILGFLAYGMIKKWRNKHILQNKI